MGMVYLTTKLGRWMVWGVDVGINTPLPLIFNDMFVNMDHFIQILR